MTKYYFIGIGGIGMSGLAKIMTENDFDISGSDPNTNKETRALETMGVTINKEQLADNITSDIDFVVATAAIPDNNPELQKAKSMGLNIIKRPMLLNEIINAHKAIAVTGTHGKTTTSSMLSEALIAADKDPLVVIGAEVESIGSNARNGGGEYSVAEVCEYQRAFFDIHPYAAIITNIDADHLDCYKDINDIKMAFKQFVSQIDPKGFLIYCGDDANTKEIAANYKGHKISYGFKNTNDYIATDIIIGLITTTFKVKQLGDYTLSVPGRHNILNALAVIAAGVETGADKEAVTKSLLDFKGADRRFQLLGNFKGVPVIDDYAHHPTEVKATLRAARERYPEKRIVAVFQPHQHSRTRLLLNDFADAFLDADKVIMPEIYAVRDTAEDIASVSSIDVVEKINEKYHGKAVYFDSLDGAKKYLLDNTASNDLILTIGAGPVNKIAQDLLS
ncbi:MAG: UDP-N-acetylmuramate--L-alanine ligase [bacterium]